MKELEVRIVRLEPMRVARVRVVSETPERDAWEKLRLWAAPKGLLDHPEMHPVFGFNNPNPSPGRRDYGYELWIAVGSDVSSETGIEVEEFPGGLYAVTCCKLIEDPSGSLPEIWRKLWDRINSSGRYAWRKTHELEHLRNPQAAEKDMIMDLYLPIQERAELHSH